MKTIGSSYSGLADVIVRTTVQTDVTRSAFVEIPNAITSRKRCCPEIDYIIAIINISWNVEEGFHAWRVRNTLTFCSNNFGDADDRFRWRDLCVHSPADRVATNATVMT